MLLRAYQAVVLALLRPYTLRELPGWGRLYEPLAGWRSDWLWVGAPTVEARGRDHGYVQQLDLSRWGDRQTYFLGRWHALAIERVVSDLIPRHGTIVDVGANRGEFALFASAHATDGKVIAFEPNPYCQAQLAQIVDRNGITNIDIRRYGLGDRTETLTLNVPHGHPGFGTFTHLSGTETITAEVKAGDDILHSETVALIKIDVEGFELHTLRGMRNTIIRDRPVIITEIEASHLARADTTPSDLFDFLHGLGYAGAKLGLRNSGRSLTYSFETLGGNAGYDAIWLHRSHPRATEI